MKRVLFLIVLAALAAGCVYSRGNTEFVGVSYRSVVADGNAEQTSEGGGKPTLDIPLMK